MPPSATPGRFQCPPAWPALLLALVLLPGCDQAKGDPEVPRLEFDEGLSSMPPAFSWSDPSGEYLTALRERYQLEQVISDASTDYERARALSRWVRSRWEHNGDNVPRRSDPISILEEAATGRPFRCVEYSIVLAGALNSVGVRARVVGLKTADVETRSVGAGHVVAEAYLRELGKWVLVDGQWDVIPTLNGTPLNAVELQRALAERSPGLGVVALSSTRASEYLRWTAPYLFYFDTRLDQRYGVAGRPGTLMLVPLGRKEPTVFQRTQPMRDMVYTHSLRAFYAPPE